MAEILGAISNHALTRFQKSDEECARVAKARKRYKSPEMVRRWLRNYRFREHKTVW